ncbi:MAG: P-type conjugative transfer protein TrbL [Thiobacillaceae bacterium]
MYASRILVAVLLILGFAFPAWGANALDTIQQNFQSASSGWMSAALPFANHLFAGLAALEFAWSGIQFVLRKNDLPEFLTSVTLKILSIAFFFTLLTMAPQWIPAVVNSFIRAGQSISSSQGVYSSAGMTPDGVFDLGPQVATRIIQAMGSTPTNPLELGNFFFGAVIAGLSGLVVVIAFAIAALQLLMTLIESYIVIGGGAIMLGFLGSRWTLPFGERYLGYAVSVGIKLFVLYLIIGLGPSLATSMINDLATAAAAAGPSTPPASALLTVAASSLIFAAVAFMVPGLAGSLMNGSPSMSLGNVAAASGALAGGIVGAGAMGLATSARMANATIGAAKAGGALGTLARSQGIGQALVVGGAALRGMAVDASQGVLGSRNSGAARSLGDAGVQGWGAGTAGGNLANRIRVAGNPKAKGAARNTPNRNTAPRRRLSGRGYGSVPRASPGGVSPGPSVDPARSAGTSAGQEVASRASLPDSDPNGWTDTLDRIADRHLPRNLPHDGHGGGISIRFSHTE